MNVTAFVIIINTKFEASIKVIGETLSVVNIIIAAWLKLMQFFWDRGISKIQQLHFLEDKPEKCSA